MSLRLKISLLYHRRFPVRLIFVKEWTFNFFIFVLGNFTFHLGVLHEKSKNMSVQYFSTYMIFQLFYFVKAKSDC